VTPHQQRLWALARSELRQHGLDDNVFPESKLGKEMNERIKLLAEQAKIDHDLRPEIARAPVWISTDEELKQFAELIVKECVAKYTEYAEYSTDKTSFILAEHNVLRHFGVAK
jgi:hypothetical protein